MTPLKKQHPSPRKKRRWGVNSAGLISFSRILIKELKEYGRPRTAERYATVINSFVRFRSEGEDIPLDRIDSGLICEYESYLRAKGICPNSSSYYMRGLRAIYNRAVEKGLTVQREPFRQVYTGIAKTVKRAVPLSVIRRIKELDLTDTPTMAFARDIFLFSFYTRGMSFIDIAYLQKKDINRGVLYYRRQKTGRQMCVKWEKQMEDIAARYCNNGRYVLPIIKDPAGDTRKQYKSALHLINLRLKKLGESLGLAIPLTMYVARHAWASIAKSKHIPLSIISEAMGHDSEKTTCIYLSSLDTSAVDKANNRIINSL